VLDIHCHILPGVDDGPRSFDEALALARFCVRDGITHVTATPHCHRHLRLLRDDILPHVDRLNRALRGEGIPLEVLPGSEIQVFDIGLYRRDYEAGRYCHLGDDPAFTLLEFPWHLQGHPTDAPGHVRWLRERGTRPILAHPERYSYFQKEPQRLRALVEEGAWLQITVDSLIGNHGAAAQVSGWDFLNSYDDLILATDAHGPDRCSGLSIGYRAVGERLGAGREEDLRERADIILKQLLHTAAVRRPEGASQ
jgi:protein-tyrosine phosphatase